MMLLVWLSFVIPTIVYIVFLKFIPIHVLSHMKLLPINVCNEVMNNQTVTFKIYYFLLKKQTVLNTNV